METKRILILALGLVLAACSAESPEPTIQPAPIESPANQRFIAHFVEQGFETQVLPNEYIKSAGRGWLLVSITDDKDPRFGFISRINATIEEQDLSLAHLDEAAAFIDPVDGLNIVYTGMEETTTDRLTLTGGEVEGEYTRGWEDGETWTQFIHTSTGQEVFIQYVYEEENLIKVFFTYLPVGWQHPTE